MRESAGADGRCRVHVARVTTVHAALVLLGIAPGPADGVAASSASARTRLHAAMAPRAPTAPRGRAVAREHATCHAPAAPMTEQARRRRDEFVNVDVTSRTRATERSVSLRSSSSCNLRRRHLLEGCARCLAGGTQRSRALAMRSCASSDEDNADVHPSAASASTSPMPRWSSPKTTWTYAKPCWRVASTAAPAPRPPRGGCPHSTRRNA